MHGTTYFAFRPHYLALVAVTSALSAPARAESPQTYAVVPITKNDEHLPEIIRLAEAIDAQLDQLSVPHVRVAAARGIFEQHHSREPVAASKEDIDLLVAAGNKALAASSNADWKTALEQLKIAMAKGARAIESTNRNYKTAQHLFHACLLAVQGMVENGNEVDARRQAIECRVRSPGMELPPDSRAYPPYVRDYLVEAREALAQSHTAPLLVTSAPPGCAVYVNGRRLGTTPYRQDNPARRVQLVQVECGEGNPGRVHTIDPADKTPPLFVNTVFEHAVCTAGGILRLRYGEAEDPHTQAHVGTLVHALGAQHGLAVAHAPPGRLSITRYGPGPSTTAVLPETFTPDELSSAVASLLERRPGEVTTVSETQAPLPPPAQGEHASARPPPERWKRTLGGAGVAVGTGALVGSWWFHTRRHDDGARYRATRPSDPRYLARAGTWIDGRRTPYILAAAGSTALTAGASILSLSMSAERYAWWAYASVGAVGAGLAAWGVSELVLGGPCDAGTQSDQRFCVLDQERRDRGALLLFNALPLMLTPALHLLFTPKTAHAINVASSVGRDSWVLHVGATL